MHWNDNDLARYWPKVDQAGVCHLWTASKKMGGYAYGFFGLHGRNVLAHRLAYELAHGPDSAEGWLVLHNCPGGDRPDCVNPAHLWRGTNADNSADMVAKGRAATGERWHEAHPVETVARGERWREAHLETMARGDRNGAYTHPERVRRGDENGARMHPERLAHGEKNGAHTHPEQVRRGENHGGAKLTENDVRQIRASQLSGAKIAAEYGMSRCTVNRIRAGKLWRHIV